MHRVFQGYYRCESCCRSPTDLLLMVYLLYVNLRWLSAVRFVSPKRSVITSEQEIIARTDRTCSIVNKKLFEWLFLYADSAGPQTRVDRRDGPIDGTST